MRCGTWILFLEQSLFDSNFPGAADSPYTGAATTTETEGHWGVACGPTLPQRGCEQARCCQHLLILASSPQAIYSIPSPGKMKKKTVGFFDRTGIYTCVVFLSRLRDDFETSVYISLSRQCRQLFDKTHYNSYFLHNTSDIF